MYRRVGRSDVYEEDTPLGKRYSPGYIAGLSPVRPFHSTKDMCVSGGLRRVVLTRCAGGMGVTAGHRFEFVWGPALRGAADAQKSGSVDNPPENRYPRLQA